MNSSDRALAFNNINVPENYGKYLEPYIFAPWTEHLLNMADLEEGHKVLDVATGTGVVARMAAHKVGHKGHVIASDISPSMLKVVSNCCVDFSNIDILQCSATQLSIKDRSIDRVFCQQGLPFIPDRISAIREMYRVLKKGGMACVAVWSKDCRCEPFETYIEVLKEKDVPPPFPAAFDINSFTMSEDELYEVFDKAGFSKFDVNNYELELTWPDSETATIGLTGTPYGPIVASLEPALQSEVIEAITKCFSKNDSVKRKTKSVMARGFA